MTDTIVRIDPPRLKIQEVVQGCEMRFSLKLRQRSIADPNVFEDVDTTLYTFLGHVKASKSVVAPLALLNIDSPGVLGPAHIDIYLTATQTTDLGAGEFYSLVKMWPNGDPDRAVPIATMKIPIVVEATL